MSTLPHIPVTEEEYLAYDLASDGKNEFVNGEILAMSGATDTHNAVVWHLSGLLYQQLRGKPCRASVGDMRVRIDETGLYAYPDLVVTCGPREFVPSNPETLLNPRVIVEVLSPSTEWYDRGAKTSHYRQRETVQEIVLVDPIKRNIDHYRRISANEWRVVNLTEGDLVLESIGATLPLAAIFEDLPPLG